MDLKTKTTNQDAAVNSSYWYTSIMLCTNKTNQHGLRYRFAGYLRRYAIK